MKKISLSRKGFFALMVALVFTLSACTTGVTDEVVDSDLNDIVGTADEAGVFETLLTAAQEAELVDALKAEGPLTVFAPTDEAFNQFLTETGLSAEELLDDPRLANILKYHVVPGRVMSGDLSDGMMADTLLSPQQITISLGDGVFINDDIEVVTPDVEASNGVIHVIDGVLWPNNIVEVASGNDDFETLVTALVEEGLDETLSGPGLFTVFAPTDAAFEDLIAADDGINDAADLLALENLADILLYHVLSGQVMAEDVVELDGQTVEMLSGDNITISIEDGKVFINGAEVIITDIQTLNGVIHVIDSVLLPPTS